MSQLTHSIAFSRLALSALLAAAMTSCGGTPATPAETPKAPEAAVSASAPPAGSAEVKPAPKPEEKHCFLGDTEANDYAHELVLAVFSNTKFAKKKITKAATPENLKLIESSLKQQMFKVACNKAYKDGQDSVEGALLVLAMMEFDDSQWEAAVGLLGAPQSFRVLPAEAQEWLKEPGTIETAKKMTKEQVKTVADLQAAAAKELKCGKDALTVNVKTRKSAQVEGCRKSAAMVFDGAWKKE
jgi:hypothetical protein